jgi:hypothetical protein
MTLMREADVPSSVDSLTFRYPASRVVASSVAAAVAVGVVEAITWREHPVIAAYIGIIAGSIALLYRRLLTARFKPSNWLIRCDPHGLYVKYRSYLNDSRNPEDATVVYLPFAEIRSAQFVRQIHHVTSLAGGAARSVQSRWVLELVLSANTSELQEALRREAGETCRTGGGSKDAGRSRFAHYPVELASPEQLDVEWAVVPNRAALLGLLNGRVQIAPTIEERDDEVNLRTQTRAEQETRLLDLVSSGRTVAAVRLARALYGYGLTEANAFIRQLQETRKS